MINKEELQYASKSSISVPYPGDDYAYDTINRLSYALMMFKKRYEDKRIHLLLNNGEGLSFEIRSKNLAHLFGIDYRELTTNPVMKPLLSSVLGFGEKEVINSYELISRIIENADKVIEYDENHFHKILNYYKVMVKTTCFIKMSAFDKFNFGVINFDKRTYEKTVGKSFYPNASKYLLLPMDEELVQFCMLGLVYDKYSGMMVPETFMTPTIFHRYFIRQEFLLPKEIVIDGNNEFKHAVASREDKKQLLNIYKSIILTYKTNSTINEVGKYKRSK